MHTASAGPTLPASAPASPAAAPPPRQLHATASDAGDAEFTQFIEARPL
jgi:hypothetical protein